MILYHVVSTYQLLSCIINKELFYKEEVGYILLSDFIKEKYPQFKQMEGLFFDKILVFNTNESFNNTENNIYNPNEIVGKYLKENNLNTHDFSEIITNLEHFDLIESIGKLDSSFIDKVLNFFGIDRKIRISENSTILLTQQFSNLRIMSFEEQKQIYQLVVDYFVPETRLVIKPHPNDLMFYDGLFPQATVIKKKFPSELIPFVFTEKPQTIMTIMPISINNLIGYFEKCIKFSDNFEKKFTIIHHYYCTVKIISELIKDFDIYEMNSDKLLLENLLNISENPFGRRINSVNNLSQIPEKSIVIIDDFNRDTLPEPKEICGFLKFVDRDSIIIFINSCKEYLFYDHPNKEIFESIVPVEILQNSTIGEIDQYSNKLFVYSKRKDTRNMINQQKFEKTLRNSKETIKVEAMSEDQLRIKTLEGILEATEKRLEHYIKLESELREKLNLKMPKMK